MVKFAELISVFRILINGTDNLLSKVYNWQHWMEFWTALSAIGSIAVAIVAVWRDDLRRPDLILEAENLNGSSVPLSNGRGMTPSSYYHLRVRNRKPKNIAKNVRVYFTSVRVVESGQIRELHPPRQLVWAPAELGELSPSFSTHKTIDLLRLLWDHLEVVLVSAAFTGEHIINWFQEVDLTLELCADNFHKRRGWVIEVRWIGDSRPSPNRFSDNPVGFLSLRLKPVN